MITQSILLLRIPHGVYQASMMAQTVTNLPAMQETQEMWVQSLGLEDPLEEEITTHSSILAWEISWTEDPGGLQSSGSQRVGQDSATKQQHGGDHHNQTKSSSAVG